MFIQFYILAGHLFSRQEWELLVVLVKQLFKKSLPLSLAESLATICANPQTPLSLEASRLLARATSQAESHLLLLQVAAQFLTFHSQSLRSSSNAGSNAASKQLQRCAITADHISMLIEEVNESTLLFRSLRLQADPIARARLANFVKFTLPQKLQQSSSKHILFPEPGHFETHALAWYLHASGQAFLDWFRAQDPSSDLNIIRSSAGEGLQLTALRILDDYIIDLRLNARALAKTAATAPSEPSASEQNFGIDQEEVAMATFSASFVRTGSPPFAASLVVSTGDQTTMPAPLMQVAVCMLLEKLRDISLHDSARIFFSSTTSESQGTSDLSSSGSQSGAPRFADVIYPKLLLLVKFGTPAIRIRLSKLLPNFIWFLRTQ